MLRLVLTTFGTEDEAAQVVRTLVEENLAACGTLLPGARSIYAWEGKVEDARETAVVLKTTGERFSQLARRLRELHSYETPEIVAFDADAVSDAYGSWVTGWCQENE